MPWQRPLSVRPNPNEAPECPLISVCVREREGETGRERERDRQRKGVELVLPSIGRICWLARLLLCGLHFE